MNCVGEFFLLLIGIKSSPYNKYLNLNASNDSPQERVIWLDNTYDNGAVYIRKYLFFR